MATAAATVNNRQGTPDSFVGRPPLFQFTAFTIFVTENWSNLDFHVQQVIFYPVFIMTIVGRQKIV